MYTYYVCMYTYIGTYIHTHGIVSFGTIFFYTTDIPMSSSNGNVNSMPDIKRTLFGRESAGIKRLPRARMDCQRARRTKRASSVV